MNPKPFDFIRFLWLWSSTKVSPPLTRAHTTPSPSSLQPSASPPPPQATTTTFFQLPPHPSTRSMTSEAVRHLPRSSISQLSSRRILALLISLFPLLIFSLRHGIPILRRRSREGQRPRSNPSRSRPSSRSRRHYSTRLRDRRTSSSLRERQGSEERSLPNPRSSQLPSKGSQDQVRSTRSSSRTPFDVVPQGDPRPYDGRSTQDSYPSYHR